MSVEAPSRSPEMSGSKPEGVIRHLSQAAFELLFGGNPNEEARWFTGEMRRTFVGGK